MEQPITGNDPYMDMYQQSAIAQQTGQSAQANAQTQYYFEEKEKGIAEAQLEVEQTLTKLFHMLRQDRFTKVDEANMKWKEIPEQERVLTEEGVERVMQVMNFYINKENLLSNFSEDQINRIMLTFRLALNGNFFMKYNSIFRQPNFDECKSILESRLHERQQIRMYAKEILGQNYDALKIKNEVFEEIEYKIEKEIQKIRVEKRKENLREWELMFEQLSQMVLATLNRAWKGEERGSLRRHTNISEVVGNSPQRQENRGGLFSWRR